jgi:quercetin dioxygenase-like cupin family protein
MSASKKPLRSTAMREIRTFELEHGEPATAWRVAQPLVLDVMAGEVWLTVEGDAEDYWLAAGESFELPKGALAWLSGGNNGARLSLRLVSGPRTALRVRRPSLTANPLSARRNWMPRWLLTA